MRGPFRFLQNAVLVVGLVFAALLATADPSPAADSVSVRGGVHPGFGRLVFDWPVQVPFEASIRDDSLVVRFGAKSAYDASSAEKALFRYLGRAEVTDDGREIRFPLKGAFTVKPTRLGAKVVLDLYAIEPAQSASGAEPEETREGIRVRAGEHPGFSRLVFDWSRPVDARLEQEDGRVTVVFDRPADFALDPVKRDLPRGITGLSVAAGPADSRVSLEVPRDSTYRLFREGNKTVVDVIAPAKDQQAAARPPRKPEPKPSVESSNNDTVAAAAEKPGTKAASPRSRKSGQSEHTATETKPVSLLPDNGPSGVADTSTQADARKALSTGKISAPSGQPDKNTEGNAPVRFATPESLRAAVAAQRAGMPVPEDNLLTLDAFRPDLSVEDSLAIGREAAVEAGLVMLFDDPELPQATPAPGRAPEPFRPTILKFGWDRETGLAAFQRGTRLWLVFDRKGPYDLTEQLREIAPHLEPIDRVAVRRGTAVRLTLPPLSAPRLSFEDKTWIVDIRRRVPLPEATASVAVETGTNGPEVVFGSGDARALLSLVDPDLHDRIVVAPVREPGLGVASVQQFAQFRVLASFQGVVLQPTAEGLAVNLGKRGIVVAGRDPLQVSGAGARALPNGGERDSMAMASMYDLEAARHGGDEEFVASKQELQRDVVSEGEQKVGVARLELARFYFAHGRAPEALGILNLLEAENPRIASDPEVLMMRGASQFLADDFKESAATLAHPALVGEREAVLWQSAMAAMDQDWEVAATGFTETDDLIDQYARPVRNRLRLLAAEARLAAGDTGGASLFLREVEADEPTEAELAQVGYLTGRRLLLDGEPEEAQELWRKIARNRHRPSSARARLALVDLGLEDETMDERQAIEELERLRFAWRGDRFEFALLRRLGGLYLSEGDYRNGLKSLRQAASHFPNSRRSEGITRRMQKEFRDLYLTDKGDGIQAVTAVALYEEYKELTPPGEEGDAIITKLADRLVEVDLLKRAGDLLEDQVDHRLKGAEKAKVAARTALIRLLERRPEDTLRILDSSEEPDLPENLRQQRRHLRARALANAGREEEALTLLNGDDASDALQLKAEVLWKQRNWKEAGLALARLVPADPPDHPLSERESRAVLNLAVALTMADDRPALEMLSESYRAAMEDTPEGDSFALLAGDLIGGNVKSISEELAQIGQIQDFVSSYRKQLSSTQLSELE